MKKEIKNINKLYFKYIFLYYKLYYKYFLNKKITLSLSLFPSF